jgi:hypothetical protein
MAKPDAVSIYTGTYQPFAVSIAPSVPATPR